MEVKLSKDTMKNIFSEILKRIVPKNPEQLFGLFPYGSLNYGLFDSTSDIDFIAPMIPSIYEIASCDKPLYTCSHTIEGIPVTIKIVDFRDFCRWKNKLQLMEYISVEEGYYYVNETYKPLWDNVRNHREDLIYSNCVRILEAGIGMMCNKVNHTLSTNTNGHYRIYHTYRLQAMVERYYNQGVLEFNCNKLFGECYEQLVNIKNNGVVEEELEILEKRVEFTKQEIEKFISRLSILGFKKCYNDLLDNLCIEVLKENFEKNSKKRWMV